MPKCTCRYKHSGKHPECPRCGSDETRPITNYGRRLKSGEWQCHACRRRWFLLTDFEAEVLAETAKGRSPYFIFPSSKRGQVTRTRNQLIKRGLLLEVSPSGDQSGKVTQEGVQALNTRGSWL